MPFYCPTGAAGMETNMVLVGEGEGAFAREKSLGAGVVEDKKCRGKEKRMLLHTDLLEL